MSGLSKRYVEAGALPTRLADGRTTFATIVQSSTVELFQGFQIAVAPVAALKALPADLDRQMSAGITMTGSALSGVLALFVPPEICASAKHPAMHSYEPRDWTREVCNQLAGRIKNRLHSCDVHVISGLPTSVAGALLERHRGGKPPEVIFGFRALRGEITVTLSGQIDFTRIAYTGSLAVAKEGEVILF